MLPQNVILAIFATLLTQGEITGAIPFEGFQSRDEGLGGNNQLDVIEAREAIAEIELPNNLSDRAMTESTGNALAVRAALPDTLVDMANGLTPRDIHDFSDWMSDLDNILSTSVKWFVGVPVFALGVGFLSIPSNKRTVFFAWCSHIARSFKNDTPSPVREGPDAMDEQNGQRINNAITPMIQGATSIELQALGGPPIPDIPATNGQASSS